MTEMADITKEELRKEITAILKDADLATMSAKKVRQQIEEKLDVDLTDRKKEVDNLVMECLQEKQDVKKDGAGKKKSKDDDDEEEDEEEEEEEEEDEEEEEEKAKPKRGGGGGNKKAAKRPKKGSSDESDEGSDEDASDDDYSPSKKGKGGAKKGKPAAKKKKGSDSDSDEDWAKTRKTNTGGGAAKKGGGAKRGGGGYTRAYSLSPELAAVVGQDLMARHEVVKKIWAIIKEKNLYDPKNKQFAICDDELLKVFGVKRFRTFGMMKYLKNHFID